VDIKLINTFDIRGTNPANKVVKEEITIEDSCPWVIPNGSPFFGDYPTGAQQPLTIVYNEDGGELKRDRDYFIEEEFMPLVVVSGRPIMCFIRLSDAILEANKKVFVTYQSVGAYFVIRNGLKELLAQTSMPGRKWDWSQIIGLPDGYPASRHLHSVRTEIGDWFEMTGFFKHMANNVNLRDLGDVGEISPAVKVFFDQLYALRDTNNTKINTHAANYNNAHVIVKADLDLGNHPNYATGTQADHNAGTAANLLATPDGVYNLVEQTVKDTTASMDVGVMPVSKFGGDSFIPPNISGSFEGLGALSACAAMCMERNGILMMLSNHNDGRNEGLYYSQMTNFSAGNARITYTSFKYQPPSLLALGVNPTIVISGSNHRIIMVGDSTATNWYLALTQGTLDAAAHLFLEVDMTEVNAKMPTAAYRNQDWRMSIHVIGEYAVLAVSVNGAQNDNYMFFRVPVASIKPGGTIKFQVIPLTYKDYDGTQFTAVETYAPFKAIAAPGGGWSRYGMFTYRQPATNISKSGRGMVVTCRKPNSNDSGYMMIASLVTSDHTPSGQPNIRIQPKSLLQLEFNPATGVITEVIRPIPLDMGFTDNTLAERNAYATIHYNHLYYGMGSSIYVATTILETGEICMATINGGNLFPTFVYKAKHLNRATAAEVLSQPMDTIRAPMEYLRMTTQVVQSPLLSGTSPGAMTYEPDGELYSAVDLATNARKMFFRKVTGGYAVRPEVTNLKVPNVKSRPLTNDIYTTNITYIEAGIGMTGSAAELTAGGVEMGSTSFSMMGYTPTGNEGFPKHADFVAPAANNMLISCPRTHTKTFDAQTKRLTIKASSFYGCRQALIDKFEALIPPEYTNYSPFSVTIGLLRNDAGGMFKGLNLGVAVIAFHDLSRAFTRQVIVLFTPVIEAPNANHPDVHLLTDFVILDKSPANRGAAGITTPAMQLTGIASDIQRGAFHMYRDGNKITAYYVSPFDIIGSGRGKMIAHFDINLTSNKFERLYSYYAGWAQVDIMAPIPRVGMSDVRLAGTTIDNQTILPETIQVYDYTGGAARILHKTNPDNATIDWFVGPTAYPEVVWSLFFQDGIRFMINGTTYEMPAETIDLLDIDPSPANKVFYIYVTLEDQKGRYVITPTKLRHSGRCMHVGTVTTSATQILTIERLQPFLIGDLELSTTRKGGIIPVSTGLPQVEGNFVFLKQSELLP